VSDPASAPRPPGRPRDLFFFTHPERWPAWPLLPVVRRRGGGIDLGVLYDFRGTRGECGYSATVFRCNLFALPATLAEFVALPRECFDTPEEMAAAGWAVD
jgi:hypothetical protein